MRSSVSSEVPPARIRGGADVGCTSMSLRSVRRPAALLVAAGVMVAGCGARWSDDQRAEVVARSRAMATLASGAADGAAAPDGAGGEAATPDGGGPGETVPPTGGAAVSDGDQPDGAVAGDALPCSAPSDAPGVTATELSIGSISSVSGPVPGIGASAAAAVRAYVSYRNSLGGVCGRQLVLQEADDGMDSARYRSIITELDPRVIGFAGGLSVGDDGSADIIAARQIPMIASRSAEGVQGQPTVFDLNPPFADTSAPIGKYDYLYSQGAHTVALVYIAVDASRAEAQTQRSLMEASGMEIVKVVELPISTLSFDSAARSVANSKADYLLFIGAVNHNAVDGPGDGRHRLPASLHGVPGVRLRHELPGARR